MTERETWNLNNQAAFEKIDREIERRRQSERKVFDRNVERWRSKGKFIEGKEPGRNDR